jgi:hypothetical protein
MSDLHEDGNRLLAKMQELDQKEAMDKAFNASPKELGNAAVAAAKLNKLKAFAFGEWQHPKPYKISLTYDAKGKPNIQFEQPSDQEWAEALDILKEAIETYSRYVET